MTYLSDKSQAQAECASSNLNIAKEEVERLSLNFLIPESLPKERKTEVEALTQLMTNQKDKILKSIINKEIEK
jgi:hypothetical protein